MGCNVSKHSSNLSPERRKEDELGKSLRGTTALAFFNKQHIVVAVESRASNEKDDDTLGKALQIQDNRVKASRVATKIIAVQVGTIYDCGELILHIKSKFPYNEDEDDEEEYEPRVLDVAQTAYEYLMRLRGQNRFFGLLIAGWDAEGDNQIYRVFIADDRVVKQKVHALYGVLGSGSFYASSVLKDMNSCYNGNMSAQAASERALTALFEATYYDKSSGGLQRVYIVSQYGVRTETIQDPFAAYSKYYQRHDEKMTLFLVVISSSQLIPAHKLVQHFSQENIKVSAAHCVAHRTRELNNQKQRLSFHRLTFCTRDDASKAYALASAHNRTTDPKDLVSNFPKQLLLTTVAPSAAKLYLNWSSRQLLKLLSTEFNGYLSDSTRPLGL